MLVEQAERDRYQDGFEWEWDGEGARHGPALMLEQLFRRKKLDGFRDGLGQLGLLFRCKRQKLHSGLLAAKVLDRRNFLCGAIVHGAGRGREFEAQKLSDGQEVLRLD